MARAKPVSEWPAYEVKARSLDDLKIYERNARTHSPEQVDEIVASIEEFGWTNPALVDENGLIVAGHGRRMAANKIYEAGGTIRLFDGRSIPQGMIPTISCAGWTEEQKRAYILADNQLAANADWDMDLLRAELIDLNGAGFEVGLIGFSDDALAGLMIDPEEAAAAKADNARRSIQERFGVVPFSVFRAHDAWWQDRKRAWIDLGIESEIGRGDNSLGYSEAMNNAASGKRPYDGKPN